MGYLVIGLGAVLFVVGAAWTLSRAWIVQGAASRQGRVVDESTYQRHGEVECTQTIAYFDDQGVERLVQINLESEVNRTPVGGTLWLRVPKNPKRQPLLASPIELWAFPVGLLGGGLGTIGLGVALLLFG